MNTTKRMDHINLFLACHKDYICIHYTWKSIIKQYKNNKLKLTIFLHAFRWVRSNTDLPWNNNISKTVRETLLLLKRL